MQQAGTARATDDFMGVVCTPKCVETGGKNISEVTLGIVKTIQPWVLLYVQDEATLEATACR